MSYDASQSDLEDLFGEYGSVVDAHVMTDRETGRPRGFAFVTLADKESATAAIEALNGKEWMGRALTVNEARPREERPRRY